MTICWAGTFDPEFGRNRMLAEYLDSAGANVVEVRETLWPPDRIEAFVARKLVLGLRLLYLYPKLLIRLLREPAPDLYLVSYPGWFDVPVVWLAARIKRRPLLFDVFISLYDTAITDRELASASSLVGRIVLLADQVAMRLSDRLLADTKVHAEFLAQLGGVELSKFGVLYLSADEDVFYSTSASQGMSSNLVLFYGTFVPLQGVETVVRAASLLNDEDVQFRLIGEGQTKALALQLAEELELQNIEFLGFMVQSELVEQMRDAALCLGVFGASAKAQRVVPHKVFESTAVGCPTITARSRAIAEAYTDEEVLTCKAADPHELADLILTVVRDRALAGSLGQLGRARFEADFSRERQTQRLMDELRRTVGR